MQDGILGLMSRNCFCFSPENLSKEAEHQLFCGCSEGKYTMSVTVYAQTVYDGAAHAMESCTVPWVIVQKTAPVFVSGNKHFFVSRKRHCISGVKWGGLLFSAETGVHRSVWWLPECPCLLVLFFFVIFLSPTSCSQRGSSRRDGDLTAQLCNLFEARYQNTLQLWSQDLAVAEGLGLLALMRSLTFFCYLLCSCFDSWRFVVAMACLAVWHCAAGKAASPGRCWELAADICQQVRMTPAPSCSFCSDRAYLLFSKVTQTFATSLTFFPHKAKRMLSVVLQNKAAPSQQAFSDFQGSAAANSHMGRIRENSMPIVGGTVGPPTPEAQILHSLL